MCIQKQESFGMKLTLKSTRPFCFPNHHHHHLSVALHSAATGINAEIMFPIPVLLYPGIQQYWYWEPSLGSME